MRLTPRQRASWLAHVFKAATQRHHRELRPLVAPHIPIDAVVVDIGAHAGQFAKLFAAMAPLGHIFAFEPSAYARSVMAPALRFGRIGNVTVIPMGLSDATGELTLHTPIKRGRSLGFGIAHLGAGAGPTFDQTVALTTLDAFAAERDLARLDFVKADIEGWELRALKGGETTLRRFSPALYLEVDAACLARAGDTPADLFAWLAALGYRGFTTPEVHAAPVYAGAGDYLFVMGEGTDPAPAIAQHVGARGRGANRRILTNRLDRLYLRLVAIWGSQCPTSLKIPRRSNPRRRSPSCSPTAAVKRFACPRRFASRETR